MICNNKAATSMVKGMPPRRGKRTGGEATHFSAPLRWSSLSFVCTLSLLLLVLPPTTVRSETLEEALATAYAHNPTLLAARAKLRATDELVPQELSNWRPILSGSGAYGKAYVNSASSYSTTSENVVPKSGSLILTQPLYRGGRTVAGTSRAENLVMAERAHLISTEQDILLAVVTAYMEVLRDQAVLELNIKNEEVLEHRLKATRDQLQVGEVTRTDVALAMARLARANADRILAEGILASSRATYLNVVGVAPKTLVNPTPLDLLPDTPEEAFAIAEKENPSVIAAHYEELAARDEIREVTGELLPSVDIVGELSRSRNSTQRHSFTDKVKVMAELALPLYQAGAVASRVREAKQIAGQRRIEIDKARRDTTESTTRAWESLKTARARIGSIEAEIRANSIALEGVREEEKVGARTVLDVLDAEQEYLDSKVALVQARRDEFVASYGLMGAIGRLSVTHLGLDLTLYDAEGHYRGTRNKFWGLSDDNN